jgi:DNA modification methylase
MERPMRNHGKRGDVVYDPFVGSGTSIIAAERCGRICCAIELDPGYCDVSVQRWETLTGGKARREVAACG